ncbi:hypothetical protein M6D93_08065 [Jatrophihabitans telluris]|uniref:Histidine kinase n=1 Tax=Jatrophihabitans telluris TaxID=2038343 RepID=A0ABY4R2K4_9ACTN|nr:hypothetical protein [Jatrophihabitans telluris]UQX89950.1 hypothetical protein M6D93_08065 [Jatrophihabitans telluris]
MTDLRAVPPSSRRRLAGVLAAPALGLLVVGSLPLVSGRGALFTAVGILVLAVAVVLLGIVIGLWRSAVQDLAALEAARDEARVDAAISAAVPGGACGGSCGSCGVDDCAVKALPRA